MINKDEIYKKLGNFQHVKNIISNKDNKIANQFILYFDNGEVFQSYSSIIAILIYNDNTYYLGQDWDYSSTTGKYRNLFLNSNKKTIEKDLKTGEAILINDLYRGV